MVRAAKDVRITFIVIKVGIKLIMCHGGKFLSIMETGVTLWKSLLPFPDTWWKIKKQYLKDIFDNLNRLSNIEVSNYLN